MVLRNIRMTALKRFNQVKTEKNSPPLSPPFGFASRRGTKILWMASVNDLGFVCNDEPRFVPGAVDWKPPTQTTPHFLPLPARRGSSRLETPDANHPPHFVPLPARGGGRGGAALLLSAESLSLLVLRNIRITALKRFYRVKTEANAPPLSPPLGFASRRGTKILWMASVNDFEFVCNDEPRFVPGAVDWKPPTETTPPFCSPPRKGRGQGWGCASSFD